MDAQVTGPGVAGVEGEVLATRLNEVGQRVPAPEIADVWLFPPLPDVVSSSEFLLFTRMLEGDTRALFSARMVPANGTPSHQVIVEHGSAPADRLPRLVTALQRRLGQSAPARHVAIEGQLERWESLLAEARGEARTD